MSRQEDRQTRLEQLFNEALEARLQEEVGKGTYWREQLTFKLKEKAMIEYLVSGQVARDYAFVTVGRLERYVAIQGPKQMSSSNGDSSLRSGD